MNKPFEKGVSGNPKGRPKNPEAQILRDALTKAKEEKGTHLIEHAVSRAYDDNRLCAEILKKILPDKIEDVSENSIDRIILIRHASDKTK